MTSQAPDSAPAGLRVLMLEDNLVDAELCQAELSASGLQYTARRVDTRQAFEQALEQFAPDLIVSDFSLPGSFDGLAALEIARAHGPDTPFIFVSGTIGEERAVEAMKLGATDYVLKDRIERLIPVINRALKERADRLALSAAQSELDEMRERLERILASLHDVVWSMADDPRRMLYLNAAAEKLYGRALGDLLAEPALLPSLIHDADRERVCALWQRAFEGHGFEAEYRINTPVGEQKWIHDRGNPVHDASGRVDRVDGVARDVTQRHRNEERIARLSRMRALLSGINSAIVRIRETQPLYEEVCRIAIADGGFACAWVGALDAHTLEVRPIAWSGDCDKHILSQPVVHVGANDASGRGLIGVAVRTRRPLHAEDAELDQGLFRCAGAGNEKRSVAVLPLFIDDEVTAVLCLYARESGVLDAEEMKLLRELVGNISFALASIDKGSRLDYLAYYDGLTGLANRRLFNDRVEQLIARAVLDESRVMLMTIDLERFRHVNETLGITAGDAVLKATGERLRLAFGARGTAARLNNDVFALALPAAAGQDDVVTEAVEEIGRILQGAIQVGDEVLTVQSKLGIALYPSDGADAAALLANAETALKKAKASRDKFLFYAREMNARVAVLLKLENQLRKALHEEEFVLYYQPRVLLTTQKIVGFEALLRWESPEHGLVAPADFMPLLEETGLILEVGHWVMRRAVADAAKWRARGYAPPPIGVNVSAIQLRQKDFVEQITSAFGCGEGTMPGVFEIELTESMIMSDVEDSAAKLRAIRKAGIKIAIDDFGTGYSSLSYLVKLPLDTLKVDRSFVADMASSAEHMAIVRTVLLLAETLRLRIVAEGVETVEQANLLRLLRCDEAQGYLYSRPVPADAVESMLPVAARAGVTSASFGLTKENAQQ